ncbi:MAG TPA: hypothetical protein VHG72_00705 [Polyangia bacterium]|nr:hypothetical protein [Polyangia bacterium]
METEQGTGSLDEKLAPAAFVKDVQWAARAIASQPSVALVSIAIWCLPIVLPFQSHLGLAMLLSLVLCVACFGWSGAERVFFRRRREGATVSLDDLVWDSPAFVGRFAAAGLLSVLVAGPFLLAAFVVVFQMYRGSGPDPALVHIHRLITLVMTVAVDLALTFVPAALVYTTSSARKAFRISFAMIRRTWPRSGLYVFCPPLALNMLNAIYPTRIVAARVAITAALAVLALIAKGATAVFYLREVAEAPASQGPPGVSAML